MKFHPIFQPFRVLAASTAVLLAAGCAHAPREVQSWRYLQRSGVRIGIIPSSNRTTQVGAPLIVDKAWEGHLVRAGFVVVNADSVITYLSSRNVPVAKVSTIPMAQLGKDLHVDYVLEDEITNWGTKYAVFVGGAVVSCRSKLIETSTGATIWASDWTMQEQSNSGGQGITGALVNAMVTAVADSMFDKSTQLARQGVSLQTRSQPYPGFAPAAVPEP